MSKKKKKKDCYTCAYRKEVPGSYHSQCHFDWMKSKNSIPKGDKHGIKNGWYNFPLNYDPVWMIGECPEHSIKADPDVVKGFSLFHDILSILNR